jgi:transposase
MSQPRNKCIPKTEDMWVNRAQLVKAHADPFLDRFNTFLQEFHFGDQVRALCAKHYTDGAGQPGVDPEVYFKMLLIGFFNNISSEREIVRRCHDSIAIRAFLGYGLTEEIPDHSTLCVIRHRYTSETFNKVFQLIMPSLEKLGLIKGKHVAMDTSAMAANASMKKLKNRMTGEEYRKYVEKLARAEGIDTSDPAATSRFDRKRKKKVSNDEWVNPHDSDAKIGKMKTGNYRMIYKPEHTIDMDTGVILDAQICLGDMADNTNCVDRLIEAEMRAAEGLDNGEMDLPIETATLDKGYHDDDEIVKLSEYGIHANVPQRTTARRYDKMEESKRNILERSDAFVASEQGKDLLKKRGMYVERSFAHVLDAGGMRRTTLRGQENIQKRYIIAAMGFNCSLAMGVVFGYGTPKQYGAGNKNGLFFHIISLDEKIVCYFFHGVRSDEYFSILLLTVRS